MNEDPTVFDSRPFGAGSQFGHYRLRRLLGRGGFGDVWEAEDTVMDRVVALKLLKPGYSDNENFRQRLFREARTAGRLREPHVVPIHHCGEIDGQLYIDMRIIDGADLHAVLSQEGPLEPARAVEVVRQIAAALDAASAAGLIHRDVKPANIVLAEDDFAYLLDFGLANAASDARLTNTGFTIGTFAYMAPERFRADVLDHRVDIYALACVLFECLTGTPPYLMIEHTALMGAHLMAPIPSPSQRRPGIPAAFDRVIARGMAKIPGERYASAGDLARAAHLALTMRGQGSADSYAADRRVGGLSTQDAPGSLSPSPPNVALVVGSGQPPKSSVERTRGAVVATSALAGVLVLSVVIAAIWVRSSAHRSQPGQNAQRSGPPPVSQTFSTPSQTKSQTPSSPIAISPPRTLAPDRLSSILLVPQEADPIMGATGMSDLGGLGSTDTNPFVLSIPDCMGAAHIVQPSVYADSGYTAILFDVLHEQGNRYTHSIEQAVATYPSAEQAVAFVTGQAGKWKACEGQNVTDSLKGANSYWTFGEFTGDTPKIALRYNRLNARGWACQRVLYANLNVVIDVKACAFKIGDEGIQVADKIAAKANL